MKLESGGWRIALLFRNAWKQNVIDANLYHKQQNGIYSNNK